MVDVGFATAPLTHRMSLMGTALHGDQNINFRLNVLDNEEIEIKMKLPFTSLVTNGMLQLFYENYLDTDTSSPRDDDGGE